MKVIQFVPALEQGGAERSAIEIAEALQRAGHEAVVVSAGGRMVESLLATGARHVAIDLQRKSWRTLTQVRSVRELLEQERPDIVHLRSRLPAWIVFLAMRVMRGDKPKLVSTIHGLNSPGWYSRILCRADHVIAVSQCALQHALDNDPKLTLRPHSVIERGIDHAHFRRGLTPSAVWQAAFVGEFPRLAGKILFLLPGRGTRLKGHAVAIRALARVREAGVNAGLLLLGVREASRQRYVAELEQLIHDLHLEPHVAMSAPRADVREHYANSRAVLQCSTRPESFGRTTVEALAMGIPVIGFDHGGVGEILAAHFPLGLVSPNDEAMLSQRMIEFATALPTVDPLLAYRLSDMQARTLSVYDQVLGSD